MGLIWGKIKDYGTLVMFSHTIFSLSFALISMLLAGNGRLDGGTILWIIIAFMGARTGANAINRVIDRKIDAMNPRTQTRQLPQKQMHPKEVVIFSTVCFVVMVIAAAMLNPLCLILSPIALFLLIIYSYTKRFTWLCHLVLGITSACAPVGAWIAVTGSISWTALFMGAANTLWVAGFDIIYGSQDYAFDTTHGIHSIPARFGVKTGLDIAKLFHLISWSCLVVVCVLSESLSVVFAVTLAIIGILFIVEHYLVSPTNLTHVKIASYGINQIISLVFLIGGVSDALIGTVI